MTEPEVTTEQSENGTQPEQDVPMLDKQDLVIFLNLLRQATGQSSAEKLALGATQAKVEQLLG